mmetsp:Transcript_35028/g.89100  ORF Transcript_35028/g.89100 Transcript_35028/m.89100 type:complete len:256 (-) Transcript_35028:625-1392(-)
MVERVLFVVEAFDIFQKIKQVFNLQSTGLSTMACALHIYMIEGIFLVVQALDISQQCFQPVQSHLLRLDASAGILGPEEAINVVPDLLTHVVDMVEGIPVIVQTLHLFQQVLQIPNLCVSLIGPIPCILNPQEAIGIGADLKVYIVYAIEGVLGFVETLDLFQQVLQVVNLRKMCLHALPEVCYPQEPICIIPHLPSSLVDMVERILLVIQALDFFQQVLQLLHLAGLYSLTCGLDPKQTVCIISELTLGIIHVV